MKMGAGVKTQRECTWSRRIGRGRDHQVRLEVIPRTMGNQSSTRVAVPVVESCIGQAPGEKREKVTILNFPVWIEGEHSEYLEGGDHFSYVHKVVVTYIKHNHMDGAATTGFWPQEFRQCCVDRSCLRETGVDA